jgi:hypothetical protein
MVSRTLPLGKQVSSPIFESDRSRIQVSRVERDCSFNTNNNKNSDLDEAVYSAVTDVDLYIVTCMSDLLD